MAAYRSCQVLQRVHPADHHHRRRECLRQLGLRAGLARHVRGRVVRRHALQPQLGRRALLAAEARLQQGDADESAMRMGPAAVAV